MNRQVFDHMKDASTHDLAQSNKLKFLIEIALVSTKLGLTSFGGPVAHLGYFHNEYITRRKWMEERSYADLVALCQFLPGPASSQVGIGIDYSTYKAICCCHLSTILCGLIAISTYT